MWTAVFDFQQNAFLHHKADCGVMRVVICSSPCFSYFSAVGSLLTLCFASNVGAMISWLWDFLVSVLLVPDRCGASRLNHKRLQVGWIVLSIDRPILLLLKTVQRQHFLCFTLWVSWFFVNICLLWIWCNKLRQGQQKAGKECSKNTCLETFRRYTGPLITGGYDRLSASQGRMGRCSPWRQTCDCRNYSKKHFVKPLSVGTIPLLRTGCVYMSILGPNVCGNLGCCMTTNPGPETVS